MDIGVLTVTVAVLAVLAIRAAARAYGQRHSLEGRSGRAWWAGLLAAAALISWYVEAGHHQRQQLASEALQVLGGPDARADCQRFTMSLFNASIYDGFVYYDNSDVAVLKRHVCHDLASYARSSKVNPTERQLLSVHLIAHEAMHIAGYWNEAQAECRAVQLSHLVAEALGATPLQARELQARYYEEFYPHNRREYVSSECRAGGSMDIHADRAEFP